MKTSPRFFLGSAAVILLFPFSFGADANSPRGMKPSVSEEACPLVVVEAPTRDGHKATAVIRTPPGNDRRPAIIFLHGGFQTLKLDILKKDVLFQPQQCRFLADGYVTVAVTFRSRAENPQTRDALIDCLGVIDYVKKLPRVDPKSVVLFGGSGGGSLALELAGETELCAVAAGEPATVLFTGMLTTDNRDALEEIMDSPRKYYSPELQRFTEEKIKRINCPVFVLHSDHPLYKINHEIVLPAMQALGKPYEFMYVPKQIHGFYNGYSQPTLGLQVYDALRSFYSRHIASQPQPIDRALIKFDPVVHPGPRVERDPSAKAKRAAMQEKLQKLQASEQPLAKD